MTDDDPSIALLGAIPASGAIAALFDQEAVGVGLVDRELRYLAINDALAAMNQLSAADHLGRTVAEVLPQSAQLVEPLLRRVLGGETVRDTEIETADPGGPRRFRGSYVPVRDGDEVVAVLALVIEVTSGRRAEDALRITQQRLQLALEGTHTGTYDWDVRRDAIRWSDNLGEMWGRGRGWAPDDYETFLATVHPDDREPLSAAVRDAFDRGELYEVEFRALRPGVPARWMRTRGHVVRDESGAPEALVGVVGDVHDRRVAQRAAEYLAAASLILADSLDPDVTLARIAELAIGELADWCAVHVVDPDAASGLRRVAVAHRDPEMVRRAEDLERRYPLDPDAPSGAPRAVRTGRSELLAEISDEMLVAAARDEEHLRAARDLELRSAMVVPILAHGEALGAITFCYSGEERHYTREALQLAEELGVRAGIALANAQLHQAEQAVNERLRALQAVTDVALSQLPLDELLRELLARVRDVLGADFAACLLLDPDGGVLQQRAALGLERPERALLRIPLGRGIAGRIATSDGVVAVPDVPAAAPISGELRDRARSLLGVPLRVEGRTVGVLHVSTAKARTFTSADEELLLLVGDRVARAVDQAATYERARETAITLQRSLLPESVPDVPGLRLATRYIPGQAGAEVGGDWYDVVVRPDGRQAVCVGDVVGRGVAAAAVMGRLRSSLRAYLFLGGGPVEAMERLDDLVEAETGATFATVLVAVVDPATGALELASAGHPPAILRSGAEAALLEVPIGRPVGAPRAPRRAGSAQLAPGDSLLLYTDGLVERRGTAIDDRLEQLRAVAASGPREPEPLLDHVVAEMLGEGAGADDVALVGLWRV